MPLVTTTEIVNRPIPQPGYTFVNGVLKGPPVEPGYNGAVPPPQGPPRLAGQLTNTPVDPPLAYEKVKVTTTRDTNSGHTHVTREKYVQPADRSYSTTDEASEENARANRARSDRATREGLERRAADHAELHGRAMVGRPVVHPDHIKDASEIPHEESGDEVVRVGEASGMDPAERRETPHEPVEGEQQPLDNDKSPHDTRAPHSPLPDLGRGED